MNRTNLVEDLTLLTVPPWWQSPLAIAVFVVSLLIVAVLLRWLVGRLSSRPAESNLLPPVPDRHAEFLARLARLRQDRATLDGYALAIACSELLREYVEWRFRLHIRFQTTREFLGAAAVHEALDAGQRARLGEFLGFCDRVKFARQRATASEGDQLLDSAETFIRSGQSPTGGTP
jgi:hypothetical protein